MAKIQGEPNALVPMIDRVIMDKGRLDLNGAEERVRVFRPVVDVAYQMRFLRCNIAKWDKGSFSNGSEAGRSERGIMGEQEETGDVGVLLAMGSGLPRLLIRR